MQKANCVFLIAAYRR